LLIHKGYEIIGVISCCYQLLSLRVLNNVQS